MTHPDTEHDQPTTTPHDHEAWSDAALDREPVIGRRGWVRITWLAIVVLLLALLVVLPPLVNVNRYQHRVAQGISDSIGRPVHFDGIHVHLLPLPGITIQNFVVQEDPAFGVEPAMRANVVEARLRLASLWRRRIEVSRIELQAPSINLVRRADGRWNLQGVVTQAGYLQNAPTAQGRAGDTPRFPYIEATDARVNVKDGETKLPWSLLDAQLALWLPESNEWRVRVNGRPLRTDTDVSDVGELEIEGSLGRGSAGILNQPLALSARWRSTPLGEAAKLFLGRDTGFRGNASAEIEVRGTPSAMKLTTDLHLHNLRRADFVPRLPMSLNAHCEADSAGVVHALHNVHCAVPTSQTAGLFDGVFRSHDESRMRAPDVLAVDADLPNVLQPKLATVSASLPAGSADYFLNWLRVFSSRIPEAAAVDGKVALRADWNASATPGAWSLDALCRCTLKPGASAEASSPSDPQDVWNIQLTHQPTPANPQNAVVVSVSKAGPDPAAAPFPPPQPISVPDVLGEVSRTGYSLRYTSADLVGYAAKLLPTLADDLPAALAGPVESERQWQSPQHWTATAAQTPVATPRRRHHR